MLIEGPCLLVDEILPNRYRCQQCAMLRYCVAGNGNIDCNMMDSEILFV